jgi:DNA-binding transcriptional LysR family regulator
MTRTDDPDAARLAAMSLASLDLNLLLVLHTVLAERSVARAAERLHVTSSAISNSLARLRAALGDPLVTRKGRGIVATPRAMELAPALARALAELEVAIKSGPFDGASCTRTFTLAVADAGQLAFSARIAALMAKETPFARLRVVGIDSMIALGDLASSEVDLHIGVAASGPGIHVERLFDEQMSLVARTDHSAAGKRLSARELAALRHVGVELVPGKSYRSAVAGAFARAGVERRVAMSVPSFTAAAVIVAGSDLVTALPGSLLAVLGSPLGLRTLTIPVPLPAVAMALCWHERTHRDPALRAFRDLVRRALPITETRPQRTRTAGVAVSAPRTRARRTG